MIMLTIILTALPVILIIALFTRKGIQTSATIDIERPRQQVFDYLIKLKNQEQYNAWLLVDPKMLKTYTGNDGEVGFIQAWDSKNNKDGKASQRILGIAAPDQIKIEIIFEKPIASKAIYHFELTPLNETRTHVKWVYEGNPSPYYLLRVFHLLLRLKKRATRYMESSLVNLKNIMEH